MSSTSFSQYYKGKAREIITKLHVSLPILDNEISPNDPRLTETTALWDTGATNSVVTTEIVNKLNLKPTGVTQVQHAAGVSTVNTYLINIYLPNGIAIQGVKVSECSNQAGSFGIIIGMDIITLGDFAITNLNNETTISFRLPSVCKIDFKEEQIRLENKKFSKAQRNDPCPCGSGKKFKNCHEKTLK